MGSAQTTPPLAWLVQKRTYFKGNYDRVLTVGESSIGTQMPNLQFTNIYTLAPDFNIKAVSLEKDCLVITAKPNGKVRCQPPSVTPCFPVLHEQGCTGALLCSLPILRICSAHSAQPYHCASAYVPATAAASTAALSRIVTQTNSQHE